MKPKKIFGIGLARTGTKSCYHLMSFLGFSAVHYPESFQDINDHIFSNDSPVSSRFEELDRRCPGSVFIHTTRELEEWTQSCLKLFRRSVRFDWFAELPENCGRLILIR